MDSNLTISRCFDVSFIYNMMHEPRLWDEITEDASADYIPDVVKDFYLCIWNGPKVIGFYKFNQVFARTWEIHANVLPEQRNKHARETGGLALHWAIEHIPSMDKLVCFIPEKFKHVKKYAEFYGFKVEGNNKKSYFKDGKLIDLYQLGMTRQDIIDRLAKE